MDDRTLLELAAKAYWGDEIDDVCSVAWDEYDNCIAYTHADNQDHNGEDCTYLWNPLADDGDALRLAVKLRLAVAHTGGTADVELGCEIVSESRLGDPYAATRRAITRAAAAIGEKMP